MENRAGNIPEELQGMRFPKKLNGVFGKEVLGDSILQLTTNHESDSYLAGTFVRTITGVRDYNGQRNPTPGFHNDAEYVTVCRLDAERAEGVGIKKNNLQFVTSVPKKSLTEKLKRIFK